MKTIATSTFLILLMGSYQYFRAQDPSTVRQERLPAKINFVPVEDLDLSLPNLEIVDTRGSANFNLSRLPGASNLQISDITQRNQKALDLFVNTKGKDILIYCQSDVCGTSLRVAEYLQYWPVKSVTVVRGSIIPLLLPP